jgi:hypothetical protein
MPSMTPKASHEPVRYMPIDRRFHVHHAARAITGYQKGQVLDVHGIGRHSETIQERARIAREDGGDDVPEPDQGVQRDDPPCEDREATYRHRVSLTSGGQLTSMRDQREGQWPDMGAYRRLTTEPPYLTR